MLRKPVVAALALFLALGGVGPAFGRAGIAVVHSAASRGAPPPVAIPTTPPPSAPTGDAVPPADPAASPPPDIARYGDAWDFWGPRIRGCESGNGPTGSPDYRALNRRTGASGAYQFMDSTWGGQHGVRKARDASPAEQEEAAYRLFQRSGTAPWSMSYRCWYTTTVPAGVGNTPLPASPARPPADPSTDAGTLRPLADAPAPAAPAPQAKGAPNKPAPAPAPQGDTKTNDPVGDLLGRRK
jgi:hypothetical protein